MASIYESFSIQNVSTKGPLTLTFTTGGEIRKIAGYTDLQSVYIHLETLENSRQKTVTGSDFGHMPPFK